MVQRDGKSIGVNEGRYIPAFSYGFLTPSYDLMMRWGARELAFKPRLVHQTSIRRGFRVLDLGCGTATLTILLKMKHPDAEVVGLDGDKTVLEIARSKVIGAGADAMLDYGMAFEMPYPNESFDRVVSSMVFHHLTRENKVRTLKEVYRVLKPSGELHVADLGQPHNILMHLVSAIIGRLEEASDNVKGLLPKMFREAGFERVEETARYMTLFGTISLYRAQKPLFKI